MNKFKIIIAILIPIIIGSLLIFNYNRVRPNDASNNEQSAPNLPRNSNNSEKKTSSQGGLTIFSPANNQQMTSPFTITGQISGEGWTAFEAQAGNVELQDEKGRRLAAAILETSGDWMNLPVDFKATLTFSSPKNQQGSLIFRNENASGLPENDRQFNLPVIISATSSQKTSVKVFFSNSKFDATASCDKVFSVERQISQTPSIARASLNELLKGPSEEEKSKGYATNINPGVTIQKLTLENGVANVDLSQELEKEVGGSCRLQLSAPRLQKHLNNSLPSRKLKSPLMEEPKIFFNPDLKALFKHLGLQ